MFVNEEQKKAINQTLSELWLDYQKGKKPSFVRLCGMLDALDLLSIPYEMPTNSAPIIK